APRGWRARRPGPARSGQQAGCRPTTRARRPALGWTRGASVPGERTRVPASAGRRSHAQRGGHGACPGRGPAPGRVYRRTGGAVVAVLPDDPVRLPADRDRAVVVIIVDQDFAIGKRQRERRVVERGGAGRPEAPHRLPRAAEGDDLARIGVVGDDVAARAHLV